MVITQVETPSKFWLNLQQIGYFDSVMEDMYWLVITDQGMCCQLGIRLEGLPRSLVIRVVNSSIGPGEGGGGDQGQVGGDGGHIGGGLVAHIKADVTR